MVIEVKDGNKTFIFGEWISYSPSFMWYRELTNVCGDLIDNGYGITLLCFNGRWSVRFFNGYYFSVVPETYKIMYPCVKEYLTAEEAKEDIDKFLHRVNSLKVFL